jgi:hydrogenase maturation protease
MTAAYAILGLGNRIESDEALGALVIERLTGDRMLLAGLPDPGGVDLIDGGTVGLALIPHLVDLDGLVVVDVIIAGEPPGTLIDLDGSALMRKEQQVMSVHDLGAGELLGALYVMDAWPRRVRVIGLEPKTIELGVDLTPEVAAGVPALLEAVIGYLEAWQREDVAAEAALG